MSKSNEKAGMKEKLPYGLYFFGQGLVYTLVSQYLLFYYTDYALIPSIAISVIMFCGKLWDGINDTLFGLLMDKMHFKNGKRFLPWLKLSAVVIPLSTIFLFSIGSIPDVKGRIAMAVLTYVLWDLCYTISDAPAFALPTAMTPNVKERGVFMTFAGIGGPVAMMLSAIILPKLFETAGFFPAAVAVAGVAFISMSLVTVFCKERYQVQTESREKEAGLKDTVRYLRENHYLLLFYAYRIVSGVVSVSMLTHMAKYCLGDIGAMASIAICSVPMILGMYLLSPFLMKRFDKIVLYRACLIATAFMYLITYFIGYANKGFVIFAMAVIAALAILPAIIMGALPQDCIEYGTFKTGIRKEGITFAMQSFVSKVIAAFAAANAGIILHFLNYDSRLSVQPPETINIIWACTLLLPMLGQVLGMGFLFAYKLRDRDVQLMSDANAGRITKEEALAKMSRKYKW